MLVAFRISSLGFGGAERVFLSVAKQLATVYGCKIDFVVDNLIGAETEDCAFQAGYRVISLNSSRTWKSINKFKNYLIENRPAVVISAYTETNASVIIAESLLAFRIPIIVSEHASLDEHWADKTIIRRLVLEIIVRFVYRFATRVIAVSKGLAEQISVRLGGREISYISNPVRFSGEILSRTAARRALGIEEDIFMIISVGRVAKPKNYLMLLRSMVIISSNNSNVRLYIVGGVFDQDEKHKLDLFIEENALQNVVVFVGFSESVDLYYSSANVFVLSSAWEGFGNVLVEALHYGLPIVSTKCKFGPAEILDNGKYGTLIDVGDFEGMANGIQAIVSGPAVDGSCQKIRALDYAEDKIASSYFKLITEVVG